MSSSSWFSAVEDGGALQVLWQEGNNRFCRIRRDGPAGDTNTFIAVIAPDETPSADSVNRLGYEYDLKEHLDGSWAIRPLELVQERGRAMLVLEDPGGELLAQLLGTPIGVEKFLRLAIRITATVSKMHHQGLVHKDIKPANVLVNTRDGEVRLTGFGIASIIPREQHPSGHLETITGTLAYMAPEQTGRMNRSIDSRSDLYALGVTFYQALTGSLPFSATEAMEWIHCHIARQPVAPADRVSGVPAALSSIIMKLLAKTSEERYQTAAGLEHDLRRCLSQFEAEGRIEEFTLGEHDTPDRLQIPEKLYGREQEIEILLAAFDRIVGGGRPELVLVSGYSGIGKSSVVNELHKVLVPRRGLFAAGKFEQFKRDIPYSTFAQAFRGLVRALLAKSESELIGWRDAIWEALRQNGQLMIDLVPELKIIIGEQQPIPELPPQDAQRRFQLVFRNFLAVFARSEHPLVLFLDDLQWLDAASLHLLEDLLTQADMRHLLLIGAYRDNEVTPDHLLIRKLEAIRKSGALVRQIALPPLARDVVGRIIADSLRCDPERAAPLAQLVNAKTAGNPFFVIQFLSAMVEQELITFDHGAARWVWDVKRIRAKGYTDNVVDLMVGKLSRLPAKTQLALQQLACLGNSAEFALLAMLREGSIEELRRDLEEALRSGLVLRSAASYRFLHDHVQEAAYFLIPEVRRAEAHLRIGRLLAASKSPAKREEAIFEIVNQLNRATTLITSRDEQEQLAELNLIAGKRAKASTAYASALNYFVAGAALLSDEGRKRRPDLRFALEFNRPNASSYGELALAETRLIALSSVAANPVDQASVACLRIDVYTRLNRSDLAVDVCLSHLRRLGIECAPHPTEEETRREFERTWSLLGRREIEELIDLPLMSKPEHVATLDVLTQALSSARFMDANLFSQLLWLMVNLSLEHGNTDASCFAYVHAGAIAGPRFGNYKAGFRFGQLGYDLVERRGLRRFQDRTYLSFGIFIMTWTKHLRMSRDLVRRSFDALNVMGDVTFAAYSLHNLIGNLLAAGDPLAEVQHETEQALAFAQKAHFILVADDLATQLALIRTLRGSTATFGCFNGAQFDESQFELRLSNAPRSAFVACWYWTRKLEARFFAADYEAAVDASLNAQRLLWTSPSFLETAEAHFYGALSHAASCNTASSAQYQQHVQALTTHHRQLVEWAEYCPANFENRVLLVEAEIARIAGRELDAEHLYEAAIGSARENDFVNNEALANELAARFYAARGLATISLVYLRNAQHCYLRWGADGKARQLEQLYPQLKTEETALVPTGMIGTPLEQLDLATVIEVSQTVAGEMVLEQLLDKLMRLAIEHAGAERALLMLSRDAEQRIVAEATTSSDSVIVRLLDEPVTASKLPETIFRYVLHMQESVILDDAAALNPFSTDPYIDLSHARSVLCLPLLNQSKLIGVLYLENNLAARVFVPARLAVLKVLASQAAISLENSRLYDTLDKIRTELARVARISSFGALSASIAHEINQPLTSVVLNASACLRLLAADPPNITIALEALHNTVRDAHRASDIIEGLQTLFANKSFSNELLDLNDATREVIALTMSALQRDRAIVQVELADGLPLVVGDRVQLQQVIRNLIQNASDAMASVDDHSRHLLVGTARGEAASVLLTVKDAGIGLAPETAEKLFDAFYTTKSDGMGLGLFVSRSIIEKHNGRIWASPNDGPGVTVTISLPIKARG